MMWLICSLSFLSIWAMIPSIVLTTSSGTKETPARACSASVWTPALIASRALSVLGLNSFVRSLSNSPTSAVAPAAACAWVDASALLLRLLRGFPRGCQCLEQGRLLQDSAQQSPGVGLSAHVRQKLAKLRARIQELSE